MCDVVWCDVMCGVMWCGVVWCGMVWCGMVWCGVHWLKKVFVLLLSNILFMFLYLEMSSACCT